MRTLITNGQILTFNAKEHQVEALVCENGKIIDLGTYEDMKLQHGIHITNTIDLHGKTAIPGLIDSHLHLSGVITPFLELDLTGVRSKDEMLNKIKEEADRLQEGEWITGRGWDENLFPDKSIPTMEELDHVSPQNPLFLGRVCGHAFLANQLAFSICQVDEHTTPPQGGEIVRNAQKEPTGLILETASTLFTEHIPSKSYEQIKHALKKAMNYCLSLGLTSLHTNDPLYLGGFDQTYRLYDELLNQEQVGIRTNLLIDYPFLEELVDRNMYTGYGSEWLTIGAIKLFADGALGRRTALLSEPYEDANEQYGNAIHTEAELLEIFRKIRAHHFPVAVHTIGDQAVENVLNMLDQFPSVEKRDRIIHASILREALIPRLAKNSLVVDIQPRFIVSDFPWIEERIGKKRAQFAYPFRTMLQMGVLCAGGSDAPIEPVDPLLGIHAAVTRRKIEESHEGYIPNEKLSRMEAIQLYTMGGAIATNEENVKGTLARGKYADLTVLSENILELEKDDTIVHTNIEMTITNGNVAYVRHQ